MGLSKEKLKKKGDYLSLKLEEWKAKKMKLEEDLRAEWAPANDEAGNLKDRKARGDLVEEIEVFGLDCFEMG